MWKFWWQILKDTPKLAWHSAHRIEGLASVILFVLILFNQKIGEAAPHWLAVHPIWLWIPLGVMFLHLVAMCVYEKYAESERRRTELEARLNLMNDSRGRVALFLDRNRHFREEGDYCIWKIGVTNAGRIPPEDVVVRIVDATAEGENATSRVAKADEIKDMLLEHTHHRDSFRIPKIVVDDTFDFVRATKATAKIELCHATRNPITKEPDATLGRLEPGAYRLRLRAEAANADASEMTVLVWSDEFLKLHVKQVT